MKKIKLNIFCALHLLKIYCMGWVLTPMKWTHTFKRPMLRNEDVPILLYGAESMRNN